MILVDSHCHLDLMKEPVENVVERAKKRGVKYLQTICTSLNNFPNVLAIAERFSNVYTSLGLHPCETTITNKLSYTELIELSGHPKVTGLGETGLDYYYSSEHAKEQKENFIQHIIAAQHSSLPVIIHTRNADHDTIDIVTTEMMNAPFSGLIHSFTASKDLARKMLDLGIYISVSGIITFKNTEMLRDIIQFVPIDFLLIETDAPYLAPVPMRGKSNEPAFVEYIAACIATIKEIEIETFAAQTTKNFFSLFNKAST